MIRLFGSQINHSLRRVWDNWTRSPKEALSEGSDQKDYKDFKEVLKSDKGWFRDVVLIDVFLVALIVTLYSDTYLVTFFPLLFFKDWHKYTDRSD